MADQNRRMSEQFGDLEYEYDLLDHLDPIARAGFDPSRVRVGDPNDRMTSADSHYQPLSDMITINPRDLANKATHAHEFRERGIDILLEELRRDGFEFIQKYGKDLYLKLSDLRDAIKNQNRARMIKDGDYNKNFEEMISEFYEKHEDVNQGAEYYAGELFSPKFGYVRGETARDSRITTPAEKMALLKEHQRKTGTPIIKYVPPPDTAQEQMDRLETDNQVAFREYLKTNPADRVERVFFKTPYAEGERRRTRPLFESVELLSQFAEKQNKKYGVRDPENFAQGGPVMNGIGTLNETARNMFNGPRGIGAYQQFTSGEIQQGPAGGPLQNDTGLNQYGQYLEQTYGNPEFDQKRDNFLREIERKEQQTFGGFNAPEPPSFQTQPATPLPFGPPSSSSDLMNNPFLKQSRDIFRNAVMPALYASGGEAMGPPPTRGPDPQGIGYFQQFADGGPVYMNNGGEVITPDDIAGMREKIMNDYGFDPEDVAVQEGVSPELFLRLLFKENRGRQGPKSPKGAIGLAQLMPGTAKELGVDPNVPYENAVGGARYLKQKIEEFDGDVLLGLAAYNAGAGNVRKYEGVPPFAETQDYVAVILGEGYSGGPSISETIRKEQGFAPSMSYEGQENDVREEQGLVPISMASRGTDEGVGSLMSQESSAPETSLRPVLRPTAPATSLRPVLRPKESSAPETSLRPVLRGQDQTLREKYAPENFERELLSPDAFQFFNGLGVMEREGKKQGIETLDPRGIRRINNFAMERSTMT